MINTESHPKNGNQTKGRVLIVDDNPDNLRLLSRLLTEKGYKVRPAPSGSMALTSVQSTLPDLILLDIKMPEMDGYEVCRRLKADEKTRHIPVLFISALAEVTDKVKGFGAGAIDYITKPFQREEVLARVATHVSLARIHKKLQQEVAERKTAQAELKKANCQLEDQLRQAQKMEAIGTLASGIAHDFNNILAAIFAYTDLALMAEAGNEKVQRYLNKVLQAGLRARDLVKQILTFSRRTKKKRVPTNISSIAREVLKLMKATLPATIRIHGNLNSKNDIVLADPVQIHQVLMNLCTNAKHAMQSTGGELEVKLTEETLGLKNPFQVDPGRFLKLSVTDTGHGIPADVRDKVFDPYFTTKSKDEGTGLGLSMVQGIVKEHGGGIHIISEERKGTCFQIVFPALENREITGSAPMPPDLRGNETILLVDDEKSVVESYGEILTEFGYKVVGKTCAKKALEAFRSQPERFDLVLTDHTMPEMTGMQLAEAVRKIRPHIPIILCSGYAEEITQKEAQSKGIRIILTKPFTKEELAGELRRLFSRANFRELPGQSTDPALW